MKPTQTQIAIHLITHHGKGLEALPELVDGASRFVYDPQALHDNHHERALEHPIPHHHGETGEDNFPDV